MYDAKPLVESVPSISDIQSDRYGNIRHKKLNLDLIQKTDIRGYPYVELMVNGKKRDVRVDFIVAQMFVPNPNKLKHVGHKDGDVSNSYYENLEWY